MLNIYERAIISTFQGQVEQGLELPTAQLKTIERRAQVISEQSDEKRPSFEALIKVLTEGLLVQIGIDQYVAQLTELQIEAQGGLVNRLSRQVDKKTKNPKSSRGTVWRRNSTVKERRRLSPEWLDGSTARTESKRKSKVELTPYSIWVSKQEKAKSLERKQELEQIQGKQEKRNYKRLLELEFQKRMETEQTREELLAGKLLEKLRSITERNGIAESGELFQRVVCSLTENLPLPILFVWGPPYEGQADDDELFTSETPESKMTADIEEILCAVRDVGVRLEPILLFADVYGSEINGMGQQSIDQYFCQLKARFSDEAAVLSWSQVRESNWTRYNELKTQFALQQNEVSDESALNASMIQLKLGRKITFPEAQKLALLYKIERLTEGKMLTEGFQIGDTKVKNIIKLATAPSRQRNDDPYEPELPRFYVKNMARAAWNKPRR